MEKIRMSTEEWFDKLAVEVTLPTSEEFLKIKETLTRIGIGTTKENKNQLFQTCHILQKRGKYYIVHFKELLLLDGKEVNLSDFDIQRKNTIIKYLGEWGLLDVVDMEAFSAFKFAKPSAVKIISFADKDKWELIPKYTIGNTAN